MTKTTVTATLSLAALVLAATGVGTHGIAHERRMAEQRGLDELGLTPTHVCEHGIACALFAPGTPWEVVEQVTAMMMGSEEGERFSLGNSAWFGGNGSGGVLTYSFPPDGLNIPNGVGEGSGPNILHQRLNQLFAAQGGEATWKALFAQSFQRWADISGLSYTEVADDGASWGAAPGNPNRGDVRIGMKVIDGSSGILAYNSLPGGGGNMVLDSSENWASGSGSNFRFFRNTIMHEHGHGIGLLHVCPVNQSKLMEPFLTTAFDGPQYDDLRGSTFLYGDRFEPNNTFALATELGVVSEMSPISLPNLSMRDGNDVDLFAFTIESPATITVQVAPVGANYLQSPQTQACNTGTLFEALTRVDLQFSILDSGQSTLVAVNEGGYGVTEALGDFVLPAGQYYLRISAAQAQGVSQIYSASLTTEASKTPDCIADITGDGLVGAEDLAALLGSWGTGPGLADLDGDGQVGASDLAIVLGAWGACL